MRIELIGGPLDGTALTVPDDVYPELEVPRPQDPIKVWIDTGPCTDLTIASCRYRWRRPDDITEQGVRRFHFVS